MTLQALEHVRFDDAGADTSKVDPTTGVVAQRWDVAELAKPTRTPEGFLRCDALITRAGVFSYLRPNGSIAREYRPPEEVFNEESLRSFALVPLTLGHPPDGVDVTPDNIHDYQVGALGRPERVGDHARAEMLVTDPVAIAAVESGRNRVSLGYRSLIVPHAGVVKDANGVEQRFDAVQMRMRGNHCAIGVPRPRAGDEAQIRIDSADGYADALPHQEKIQMKLVKIKIGNLEIEVPEETASAISALQGRADAAEAQLKTEKRTDSSDIAELRRKLDQQQGTIDVLNAQLKTRLDSEEKVSKREKQAQGDIDRLAMFAAAAPILDKKLEEVVRMDADDVMREVVAKLNPDLPIDGKDAAYMRGAFEAVIASRVDSTADLKRIGDGAKKKAAEQQRQDNSTGENAVHEARARMIADMQNAWKPKEAA